jgi:integrase
MAWLEKRGKSFHVNFFHGGRHYSRSLKTGDPKKAEGAKARLEENLADVERGRLETPAGADLAAFLLSDGRLARKVVVAKDLTLGELFGRYQKEVTEGSKDPGTRYTEDIHIAHLLRLIGGESVLPAISTETLQGYVNTRSAETGRRGERLSHVTIKKEVGTFAAVWNKWAFPLGLVAGPAPTKGLTYRKTRAKPPFQTFEQITRQVARGGLTEAQQRVLWDSVFLTLPEVTELLGHVRGTRFPWVYPMFVFAAHTGARRSEVLRSQVDDFDFAGKMVRVREKKKDRTKEMTFRHVPLSPFLAEVMMGWLAAHPGGRLTVCEAPDLPITVQMSSHHFDWALEGTKWENLTGWHTLRHSFASNCALKGVDQRIIDEWMGHQTEEMRRRYRHLFPHQQQAAIRLVFGEGP